MSLFKPEISASAVAALIGMNPYRAPHEVMYQVMQKNKAIKDRIRQLETLYRRIPMDAMKRRIMEDRDVRKIVWDGLEETRTNPDIRGVVDSANSRIGVVTALRYASIPEEHRLAISKEVASEIHKRRGLQNENTILNNYETATGSEVTERNTRMCRKDYNQFSLIGRIDGYVAKQNRIVDSKERTYYRENVPLYDEVQMRVYMDLLNATDAELIERFPDKTVRTTVFTNDSNKWGSIVTALRVASEEMKDAMEDDSKLLRIIEANTFTLNEPEPSKDATREIGIHITDDAPPGV